MTRFYHLRLTVIYLIAFLLGCSQPAPSTKCPPPNDDIIIPACGIHSCYVGMDLDKLGAEWTERPNEAFEEDTCYYYSERGLVAVAGKHASPEHPDLVAVVNLYFRPPSHYKQVKHAFQGAIARGIDRASSIEDVLQAYGQPLTISVTYSDTAVVGNQFIPGIEHVALRYTRQGIGFYFREGKLEMVSVRRVRTEVDPFMDEDIGDTEKYRAMVPAEQ